MKKILLISFMATLMLFGLFSTLFAVGEKEVKEPVAAKEVTLDNIMGMVNVDKSSTYVLPRPIVYFAIIEEVKDEFDFSDVVKLQENWNYTDFIQLSLNLGMRSADSMALYSGDNEDLFIQNNETIEKMINILGVDEFIRPAIDSLKKALSSGDDSKLKEYADDVYTSVESTLVKQDNKELAEFMTLGSWIEGAYLVSKGLLVDYDPEISKIAALDTVVDAYIRMLGNMEELVKYDPILKKIEQALPKIKVLVTTESGEPVSRENIAELNKIVLELKTTIEKME